MTTSLVVKICIKCKIKKDLSCFYKNKSRKDGLQNICKECCYLYSKEYKKTEKYKKYCIKYKKTKKYKEYEKKYYQCNKEKIIAYQTELQKTPKARKRQKEYREKNREKIKEHDRNYRENNREKIRKTNKNYRKNNPEKLKIIWHKHRARRRKAEGTFDLEDIQQIFLLQERKCYYCQTDFIPTETCKTGYHIEHKTPLSRNGTNWPDNLCLACPECNLSKNKKTEEEFLEYLNKIILKKEED